MPVVTTVGPLQQSNQPILICAQRCSFFIISSFRMWKLHEWKDDKTEGKDWSTISGSNLTQHSTAYIQARWFTMIFLFIITTGSYSDITFSSQWNTQTSLSEQL